MVKRKTWWLPAGIAVLLLGVAIGPVQAGEQQPAFTEESNVVEEAEGLEYSSGTSAESYGEMGPIGGETEPRTLAARAADDLTVTSLKVSSIAWGTGPQCNTQKEGVDFLCWNSTFVMRMDFTVPQGAKPGKTYELETQPGYAFVQAPGFEHTLESADGVVFASVKYSNGRHAGNSANATITLADAVAEHHQVGGHINFSMKGTYALDSSGDKVRPVGLKVQGKTIDSGKSFYIQPSGGGTSIFSSAKISADGKPQVTVAAGAYPGSRTPDGRLTFKAKSLDGAKFLCAGNTTAGITTAVTSQASDAPARKANITSIKCNDETAEISVDGLKEGESVIIRASAIAPKWATDYRFDVSQSLKTGLMEQTISQTTPTYDYGASGGKFDFVKKVKQVADTNKNGLVGDVGDTIHYGFEVTNTGAIELFGVEIADPMLGVKAQACFKGTLNVGATIACDGEFQHVLTKENIAATTVVNKATATVILPDGTEGPTKESTVEVPTKTANPGLELNKSVQLVDDTNANKTIGDIGDTIHYKLIVKNTGNTNLVNITVSDELLGIKDAKCADSLEIGAEIVCPGSFKHVITAADQKEGKVVNVAIAKSKNPDGTAGPADEDEATQETTNTPAPPPAVPVPVAPAPAVPVPTHPEPKAPETSKPAEVPETPEILSEPEVDYELEPLAHTGSGITPILLMAIAVLLSGVALAGARMFARH